MKVKKMQTGYVIRLNDSEFAALEWLIGDGSGKINDFRPEAKDRVKFGLRSFVGGLKVTEDRRK